MNCEIFPTPQEAAVQLAADISGLIRQRAAAGRRTVLGLATGRTPLPLYRELVRLHREEGLSFGNVVTFNLDEYCGLDPADPRSYRSFMWEHLFSRVDIPADQVHIPSGNLDPGEVERHCREYERAITEAGGIDLQILGIGRTGHIGFNEPGSGRFSRTGLVHLDPMTRGDAAADFGGLEHVPELAVTMGCGTILEARRIVMMAWGEAKSEIVAKAVEGPLTDDVPASYLQRHADAMVCLDEAAAAALRGARVMQRL